MAPLLFFLLLFTLSNAHISSRIGVNYGQLGDNLPSPSESISLIKTQTKFTRVKIYDANPSILKSLSKTHLQVSIMVPNQIIPSISTNRTASDDWIRSNVLPFYPSTKIRYLLVGNEILSDYSIKNSTWPNLVPAMKNIKASLKRFGVGNVKVGTPLAMDALQSSFPPSNGTFRADIAESVMKPMLEFLTKTKSYFFVDAYPYFVWAGDRVNVNLDYALFRADGAHTYTDPKSGLLYTNLLDQMLDAVVFAMDRVGFGSVRLAVAETGWPNSGDYDQIGANTYNAAIYNRNLARRFTAKPAFGTPARPGVVIPVFVFSLYNENQKPGPGTERHWGVFYPNRTAVYEVDWTGKKPDRDYEPLPVPTNDEPYKGKIWCVAVSGANVTDLGGGLAYACGQGKGTCDAIQKGRECYKPNTVGAHASYAFNAYWQQFRSSGGTCYFNGVAQQTIKDPSYGSCKFPSSTS
ncbi:putative glucan endo-1,3-beta-glucosidase A6 [Acorus calamus]|uniref:glucan endo-1,3-beta-D-glucosidase n=1 Tax=Acorus calamus TaxID=4465 RepID=A0AAV9DYW9_ACOCL|nr:putative glucan endo-1,3-beta-glucosidase A6 [Acorus calamus]